MTAGQDLQPPVPCPFDDGSREHSAKVRDNALDKKDSGAQGGKEKSKFKPRTIKEIKTCLDTNRKDPELSEKKRKFLDTLFLWVAGQRTDAKLLETLGEL